MITYKDVLREYNFGGKVDLLSARYPSQKLLMCFKLEMKSEFISHLCSEYSDTSANE